MTIECEVKSIEALACNTYRILLHPENPVSFKAGQYLMVVMGERTRDHFLLQAAHAAIKESLSSTSVRLSIMRMLMRLWRQ